MSTPKTETAPPSLPSVPTPALPDSSAPPSEPPTPVTRHPPPVTAHKRSSKIARLPIHLRNALNLMLRDGAAYSDIIKKFAKHDCDLNPANLSRWHSGGYQDWLTEQTWLEEMCARLDFASDVVHEKNGRLLQEASLRIAVTQMYNLLVDFDPAVLKPKIAEDPGVYTRLLGSLCKLTDGALRLERHREEQATKELFSRSVL